MQRFIKAQRLTQKAQFDTVYQRGAKLGDSCFLILYRTNNQPTARLGLSVSARTVGNAVNRNRIKRVIRETFRHLSAELPNVDLVVNTRAGAREADNASLATRLQQHFRTVIKRCVAS